MGSLVEKDTVTATTSHIWETFREALKNREDNSLSDELKELDDLRGQFNKLNDEMNQQPHKSEIEMIKRGELKRPSPILENLINRFLALNKNYQTVKKQN